MTDALRGPGGLNPGGISSGYGDVVRRRSGASRGTSFDATLEQMLEREPLARAPEPAPAAEARPSLSLSRHAAARIESRGMTFDEAERGRLDDALTALSARGAQEALVLTPDAAYLVGVPRAVVITAMPRSEAMGTVFTQIDSTYVAM